MVNTSAIWQQAAPTTYHHPLTAQQEPYKNSLCVGTVSGRKSQENEGVKKKSHQ